jgi:FAD:protein FMN transferase
VFPVMGTAVSLVVPAHAVQGRLGPAVAAIGSARDRLESDERRFSHYRPTSEASRYARGEVAEPSVDLAEVLAACADLERDSGGAFRARRPDGRLDLAGFVKGWATDRAAAVLDGAGLEHWCLGVGGDVVARGTARTDRAWRVAIRDPARRGAVAGVVALPRSGTSAVATSGRYERGDHVWAVARAASDRVASLTVVGPHLALADAYATAALALGATSGLAFVHRHPGYAAMAVLADGSRPCTPTFLRWAVSG